MSGEERMNAWITAIVVTGCVMLAGIVYKGCEGDNAVDIARIQAATKVEQLKAQSDGGVH